MILSELRSTNLDKVVSNFNYNKTMEGLAFLCLGEEKMANDNHGINFH